MFKLNTKFHADLCSTYLFILNAMATQYTWSLKGIYHPRWLVQWSRHCSYMCIPVHSPCLPGYTDVTQTVLIILTMVGLFADRFHILLSKNKFLLIPAFIYVFILKCMEKGSFYTATWNLPYLFQSHILHLFLNITYEFIRFFIMSA